MKMRVSITLFGVLSMALILVVGCGSRYEATAETLDRLAIKNKDTLSAASKRAIERGYDQGPQWFIAFNQHDLKGDLAYEPGMIRRDPSDIIRSRSFPGISPRSGMLRRKTAGIGRSTDARWVGGRRVRTMIARSSRRR